MPRPRPLPPRPSVSLLAYACACACAGLLTPGPASRAADPVAPPTSWSGIHPHLAFFNDDNECGTGAVVPWADRLWAVTYSPHRPAGSTDQLYEIDRNLRSHARPESIGGTPANRMIHRESRQLFIGPYAIDRQRHVRAIPYSAMPGRPTGTARHLTDPAHKVYFASMEEGFYEVDVRSLAVTTLYPDANRDPAGHAGSLLPGYHGKGLFSGQGVLVYANNGELSPEARQRPDIASGCLAEWDGRDWHVVRRNQFTEVTGPGGITGSRRPASDPLWSIGWDHRSLILMLRDRGTWHAFRLPKASHCYDGAHGWNTEWPRIRDVGTPARPDFLMTMHGGFWRFPPSFSARHTDGLRPRSTYLKVIGDFCRWNDQLVFGCDDSARSEFLNRRRAKAGQAGPGQSQSNLWFTDPDTPDHLGPALGRGAVWLDDDLPAGALSEPYLWAGFERRAAHLHHRADSPVTFDFEIDRRGRQDWTPLRSVTVPPGEAVWMDASGDPPAEWIRVRTRSAAPGATVWFTQSRPDPRPTHPSPVFDGLAGIRDDSALAGLAHARGEDRRTLGLAATRRSSAGETDSGYYELGLARTNDPASPSALQLRRVEDPATRAWITGHLAIPHGVLSVDHASVIYTDDAGHRWRLPKGDPAFDAPTREATLRLAREVVTERDLFSAHGTFYELPAENAGGFPRLRPIASHDRLVVDFTSYRGLLVLTGVAPRDPATPNPHVIRSADGQAAVWVGTIDDLWQLGKPTGHGGPWRDSAVRAGEPSDPYLLTGFDRKTLTLSQDGSAPLTVLVEVDPSGDGRWLPYRRFEVPAGAGIRHDFPAAFQAAWLRVTAAADARATAQLVYD